MACDEVKDLEAGSFEMLFRELYEPLCRYGRGIVEDDTVCEDIVEDAFVYLWDNRETLVVNTSVKKLSVCNCASFGIALFETAIGAGNTRPSFVGIYHLPAGDGILRGRDAPTGGGGRYPFITSGAVS